MSNPENRANGTAASVHLVLQGKGGVGKSFVSAILAQYFRTKSTQVHCMDTDPVNATFAQYRLLEAEHLKVLRRGTIHEKQFDAFVEKVCHGEGVFVVDTGATTFVPLWNYILENEILDFFRAHGRSVFVHSVLTGGQAMTDTLNGLERLAQTTSQKNVIVWLNEYFGEVTKDGRSFEEFKIAEQHAAKLIGTVVIRDRNPHTYGDDVRQMLEKRLTFDEAIKDGGFFLVSKQRLAIVKRELFEQLDKLQIA
jgi:CobQ/CobB/MinD/ParA nucleotide binding domain